MKSILCTSDGALICGIQQVLRRHDSASNMINRSTCVFVNVAYACSVSGDTSPPIHDRYRLQFVKKKLKTLHVLLPCGVYRTNEILNESNEIAGLQKRFELSGREVLLLQNELDNKIRNMSDRTLEMGQVSPDAIE